MIQDIQCKIKTTSVIEWFFLYKIMNFYQSSALLRQLIVNKIKGSPHNQKFD
jgi:hypothetical protein